MINEELKGIEQLENAVEQVATDLERRQSEPRRSIHGHGRWVAAVLATAALVTLALLLRPAGTKPPEVVVVELRVHGRVVPTTVVDAHSLRTLIIMPLESRARDIESPLIIATRINANGGER